MRLVVGYLATPGGADAVALGARLARTLGAELELCIVLPVDSAATARVTVGGYDELLVEQAEKWLSEAGVPEDVVAHTHVSFAESFADGLIQEVARLEADAIVVGGSGGGLAGPLSLGSVVNELLHSAPVPVAVAPRGTRRFGRRTGPRGDLRARRAAGRGSVAAHCGAVQQGGGHAVAAGVAGRSRPDIRIASR